MREKTTWTLSGYLMLTVGLLFIVGAGVLVYLIANLVNVAAILPWAVVILIFLAIFTLIGLFVVNPNDAR